MEEDKRLKLLAKWEAKKVHLEWELQEEEKKKVSTIPPSLQAVDSGILLCFVKAASGIAGEHSGSGLSCT